MNLPPKHRGGNIITQSVGLKFAITNNFEIIHEI